MACSSHHTNISRILECSVCILHFNGTDRMPQVIKCGHSFCKSCVGTLCFRRGELKCPKCRTNSRVNDVATNYVLLEILDGLCEECLKQERSQTCSHCSKRVCQTCLMTHSGALYTQLDKHVNNLSHKLDDITGTSNQLGSSMVGKAASQAQRALNSLHNNVKHTRDALDKFEKDQEKAITDTKQQNLVMCRKWRDNVDSEKLKARSVINDVRSMRSAGDMADGEIANAEKMCSEVTENLTQTIDGAPKFVNCDYVTSGCSEEWFRLILGGISTANIPAKSVAQSDGIPATPPLSIHPTPNNLNSTPNLNLGQVGNKGPSASPVDYRNFKASKIVSFKRGCGQDQFNDPIGIAMSSKMDIVISDSKNHRIKIYDSDLQVKAIFGSKGSHHVGFMKPLGLCISKEDELYICDHENNRIQVFSLEGKSLRSFGRQGPASAQIHFPSGISCDAHGLIYVCDWLDLCVKVYQKDGKFVRRIGVTGLQAGQISAAPIDVAVTKDNKILVSLVGKESLMVFKTTGEYMCQYPVKKGSGPSLSPMQPSRISVNTEGHIIISDTNGRLVVLNKRGNFLYTLQSNGSDVLEKPSGVVASAQKVVVCDHNKLVVFS